jgi:hypothetical protein
VSATWSHDCESATGDDCDGQATFKPDNRTFTKSERLTIRADVLPDDPEWHSGRMPTLIHTLPLNDHWNGRPLPPGSGVTSHGVEIEASHATIRGLKVLGAPVVETPRPRMLNRIYPIGRFGRTLDDLEISQCLLAGDKVTNPNHLPIIANGNGMNIHHCVFYNTKLTAVYSPTSQGVQMIIWDNVRLLTVTLTFGASLMAVPTLAQQGGATAPAGSAGEPAGVQKALANDVATLSDKFTGLARVMAGKYGWKPSPAVRSMGDVLNLIVMENKMLVGVLTGGGAQGGGRGNAVTDPAQLQEALTSSYAALKEALAGLSNADLNTSVKLFGRDTRKQGAALMLLMDQHEHLGQSIAYARSNNIVPPWSK